MITKYQGQLYIGWPYIHSVFRVIGKLKKYPDGYLEIQILSLPNYRSGCGVIAGHAGIRLATLKYCKPIEDIMDIIKPTLLNHE